MSTIKVAIAGLGSCASSLVQLIAMAKAGSNERLSGVARSDIGGYSVSDMTVVGAFDVDREKVGIDIGSAIFAGSTAAKKFWNVESLNTPVEAGPLLDGLVGKLEDVITPHPQSRSVGKADVVASLRRMGADVLLCHLPTGASEAIRTYAAAAAEAGMGFINSTPESIARDRAFRMMFEEAGVPLLGDDTKSMVGATTLHTSLIELLLDKGVLIDGTYQINVGGNTDFLNLSDSARSSSKIDSKRNALRGAGIDASQVLAGPNGFVKTLGDTKVCHLNLQCRSVLGSPLRIDLRLEVEDSPNAAGVMIDALRIAKSAKDRGLKGVIDDACPFLFKSPPLAKSLSESVTLFDQHVSSLEGAPS